MAVYNAYHMPYIIMCSILMPITLLAVILRFVSRSNRQQKFQIALEDWFAVVALLFFFGFCGAGLWTGEHGGGYSPYDIPYPVLVKYLKVVYAAEILIPPSMAASKYSILLLYRRIFSVHRGFSIGINILAVLNILWMIAAILGCVFQCSPIREFWIRLVPGGKCDNFSTFTVAIEIPNSLIDFVMMILPITVIRKLQLNTRDKFVLGFIFLMGGLVGIIGFVRIGITYHPNDYDDTEEGLWVTVQLAMAILCCCFPTYRPLIQHITIFDKIKSSYNSLIGGRSGTKTTGSKKSTQFSLSHPYAHPESGNYDLGNFGHDGQVLTQVEAGSRPDNDSEHKKGYPLKSINVESMVEIV